MKKTLILMQGVPGSGKSTVSKGLLGTIYSTDDFWYDKDGRYNFESRLLGQAHRQNQVKAEGAMRSGIQTVIIDNTNIKKKDITPYLDAARINGYDVQVIRVIVDPQLAIDRQAHRPEDRRIPEDVIRRMHSEMEDLL